MRARLNSCGLAQALATLALASPVVAALPPSSLPQSPSANSLSGVTVTAPNGTNSLVDPTSQYVRQNLPQGELSEQLPRFRDDICVQVLGLPTEFNAFIRERVIALAHKVGAPVAKSGACVANVHVIFSKSPQAQIDDIAKRREILLGFFWPADAQAKSTFKGPIQAWYVTRVRDAKDGRSHLELHTPAPGSISEAMNGQDRPHGEAGSRLSNGMSAELVHTLILADAAKVSDAKVGTVADYVAVLALARWRNIDRCHGGVETVLSSLDEGCEKGAGPDAATPADLALLKALYNVDPRETGAMQRASIAGAIRKAGAGEQ